jgi:hypothetical protein
MTFQGFKSAILAGKAGRKAAVDRGIRTEMHGRMGRVDADPQWYVYGPAVPGKVEGTQNKSLIWGEAAGPLPFGTTDAGMYWVLGRHQDDRSWPVNRETGISDGQVLRSQHRTGVMTNPPPANGSSYPAQNHETYRWYDAVTNREGM